MAPGTSSPQLSSGSTSENVVTILVQYEHQVRPTELAGLAQLCSKDLGLNYRKFGARESVSGLIGEHFRAVKNVEKVSHRFPIIRKAQESSDKYVRIIKCMRHRSRSSSCTNGSAIGLPNLRIGRECTETARAAKRYRVLGPVVTY
jgi:hypothetical protein